MVRGLRIKRNKNFEAFTFNHEEELQDNVNEQGEGALKILEEFDFGDNHYKVYGYDQGDNFNQFDLFYATARGDILFVASNINSGRFRDASILEVDTYYSAYEDLNDGLISDELGFENGDYDYSDSFIVDDRLDGIDYPDMNSDDERELLGISR